MAREFIVGLPAETTKDRMKEVQFYLIHKQLKKEYGENIYLDNIVENLSQLFGCKTTNIHYAIGNLATLAYRPTTLELILANKYLNIGMRTLCGITKRASKTMYNTLERYISEEGHYALNPKFSSSVLADIELFNRGFNKLFGPISDVARITTGTSGIYD